MIKQLLIIFGILFSLNSCEQNESRKIDDGRLKEVVKTKVQTSDYKPVKVSYIENDSLVFSLKSKLEKIVRNKIFAIQKKPIQNRHVDNLVDTIITRTFDKTKIMSYRATDEEWVYYAKIVNSEFELNDFIKIGSNKNVLDKLLRQEILNDTVEIRNLEQTSIFKLIFQSKRLQLIEYNGYVD
ncbi:hypothetical protein [Dokdonia sp. Asnod3-C12]|uniref:hypothetical protein n=1 Tax=Dokdonia sp. Asnod3-C12 TaxID=3160575 RepID=UPI0038645EE0